MPTSKTTDAAARARPRLHRFTAREYHAMGRAGVLRPGVRTELVNGRILTMSPIGFRHALVVERLTDLFYDLYRHHGRVRVQSPIALGPRSEPEPDVMLLRAGTPPSRLPRPSDVLLVVEVSDATLAFDRDVKVPLYARAAVPEVWVVDVAGRTVEAWRAPVAGAYCVRVAVAVGGRITPVEMPGAAPVEVAALFEGL